MKNSKHLQRAIDTLLAGRSPRREARKLDETEREMLLFAQLLRGTLCQGPSDDYVTQVHNRQFPRRLQVSRRIALLSGVASLAAGLVAGFELDRVLFPFSSATTRTPLVGRNGHWFPIANVADVPDETIRSFTAGALQGFLVSRHGQLHAVSRICTHMGCVLHNDPREGVFVCPCHGAEFDLNGHPRAGQGYPQPLPPLPAIAVRIKAGSIEVWSI